MKKRSAIVVVCSLLALVTLACYWPVTAHKFVDLDDRAYIYDNPHVKPGLTWSGVLWAFRSGYASNWHPLTWISHMVDCQLYGLNPAGHHLTNLLFHIANTLLLFLLLQRMTGSLWRSACVAALFAWHPLHVESVAWAAERKDVLSTFFFLLALWAYVRYVEGQSLQSKVESPESKSAPRSAFPSSMFDVRRSMFEVRPSPPHFWYWTAVLLFAFGLMSKPMLVTLPFVLLLLDFWPLQRLQLPVLQSSKFKVQSSRFKVRGSRCEVPPPALSPESSALWPLLREKLPFFALAFAASLVTYLVQRTGGAVSSLDTLPLHSRIANALVVYVRYLSQTLWPAHLTVLYPYSRHLAVGSVVGAALLLAGLSSLFLFRAHRHPVLIVGWLWWLGTLVPTIGLVQVGSQSMADRYMYIPSIGLFLLIVWGVGAWLGSWPYKRYLLGAAGTLALAGCLASTWCQLKYWKDSETLYWRAIAVNKQNYLAYEGLGTALMSMGRLEEAAQQLTAALKYRPTFANAHINLGKTLIEQGNLVEAAEHLSKAVQLAPDDAEAHYNLGTLRSMQGKADEAIVSFSEALRLKSDYGEAHGNLGVALMRQGKLGEGATHLAAASRLNPNNPEAHYNLGLAILELKHPREAAEQFAEALRLNPNAPGPHYHLALALVRQDKPQEALPHAQKARDLALAASQPALVAKAEELLKQLH